MKLIFINNRIYDRQIQFPVPQMDVGQYARFLANKTGSIGQHFYDLLTNKENLTIDGLDGGSKKDRAYNDVGAFDGKESRSIFKIDGCCRCGLCRSGSRNRL